MPRVKKFTPKESASKANVDSYKHKDTRKNIPTQELSHLKREAPSTKKYSYDPSLDPQLIWSGKAMDEDLLSSLRIKGEEEDACVVDTVPIYIQENISPEAIINRLKGDLDQEGTMDTLWGESAHKTFTEMVDFYKHEDNWANRMVLGDSLLVMNSLLEKEAMRGKVQMVYIDPPYGIKFGSNWQVSTRKKQVQEGSDNNYTRQPEQVRAFRDTWELGIHSYLSYLRDRLITAREMLTDSGSCMLQINDENLHIVRNLMDEVFGSENFVSTITFIKTSGFSSGYIDNVSDYIIWYAKDRKHTKYRQLYRNKIVEQDVNYKYVELSDGTRRLMTQEEKNGEIPLPQDSRIFRLGDLTSQGSAKDPQPYTFNGKTYIPGAGGHWKAKYPEGMDKLVKKQRVAVSGKNLAYVRYADDFPAIPIANNWTDTNVGFGTNKIYVVQTLTTVIERCLLMTTDPGDLVLDPTCGSGTTAYVAEQWGRRWITTDTSRVALALARTRLMTSKFPWYRLKNVNNIKEGFEYKTVPHVTLKSLANDEEPEREVLYDQPHESKEVVRVAGPFTVESLSPHRISESNKVETSKGYVRTVVDNMRKAGVQTGEKGKRIEFTTLDIVSGGSGHIHAAGEYKEAGEVRTVAVSIGPEYGSMDDDMVRDAVKEASKYYDLLVVAAPAFDGSAFVSEENPFDLTVIRVKVSPDLSMGDLLKKTGSANLFVAFGEPDVVLHKEGADRISVEVRGVDVYDPTTGQLRSESTDDIACWFIDTAYNEEAFFVTHAYFTGADKPYEKLKKALRVDIDEDLWDTLYTTRSRSFPVPRTGKIAVKVINHYGDEVMRVISTN